MKRPFSLFTFALFTLALCGCSTFQQEQDAIEFRLPEAVTLAIAKDKKAASLFEQLSAQLHRIARTHSSEDGILFARLLEEQFYDAAHPYTNAAVGLWSLQHTRLYALHGTDSPETFQLVEDSARAIDEGVRGIPRSGQPTRF